MLILAKKHAAAQTKGNASFADVLCSMVQHGGSVHLKGSGGQAAADILPGHSPPMQLSLKTSAVWKYYMDDGVDGKADGWYDFTEAASKSANERYNSWQASGLEEGKVSTDLSSGHFNYDLHLEQMTQR